MQKRGIICLPGYVVPCFSGVIMDPITLIVTALAAGAGSGLTDTAAAAVHDAYLSLKALARRRLGSRADGELVLARHAEAPKTWEGPLAAELSAAGADADLDLIRAAQTLMRLADEAGYRSGKYHVDARGSQGVQVGDHNTQRNVFGYHAAPGDADGPGR